ncbi:hypothetical protein GCM10022223_11880 [Kineosporia mesophila]|uniref:Transmembrane protein n=1 Tax=Kineosporia mesophila TaxID=566012 RepID=A0ABP6Z708_9ACTN|nr:hypothetical protein [Kineosporia mesophila]MCD5352665.1 hypothetical protein [Kineosporia mesophila]
MTESERNELITADASPGGDPADAGELAEISALAQRRSDRWFTGVRVFSLLAVAVTTIVVLVIGDVSSDDDSSWWVWLFILAIAVLPLVLMLAVLRWLRRRGARWLQPVLAAGVDRERRKKIAKAIRSVRPVDPRDQVVAQDLAERILMQRWILFAYLPVLLLMVASRLLSSDRFLFADVMIGVGALGYLISLPLHWRNTRRARSWIDQYGTGGTGTAEAVPDRRSGQEQV